MKKVIKIFIFTTIFLFLVNGTGKILTPYNERIKRWDSFYSIPKNELDVVFLGNSHSYATYYPNMIDNLLEINSFNMASNSQHIDQLYFNLKEILKYQKPKVIFIELFSLSIDSRQNPGNWFVYDNLNGQKFSLNKIESILKYRPKKDRINSLVPLIQKHETWKDSKALVENIKNRYINNRNVNEWDGYERMATEMMEETTNKYRADKKEDYKNFQISNFNISYLEKIKELSEKYDFKVIYVYSPMYREIINENYYIKHNKFKEIADKYADDLLDFTIIGKKLGMNERWFENGYIGYQHTSFYGSRKITEYVAMYLKENFEFTSRKNEEHWQNRNSGIKNIGLENIIGENLVLMEDIKIDKIFYTPINKKAGIIEIKFSSDSNIEKLKEYNIKIHAQPTTKEDKAKLKNGYQNWDIGKDKIRRYDDYIFGNREVYPELKIYNLNIALYKTEKDQNGKVRYPNFGEQLNLKFNIN